MKKILLAVVCFITVSLNAQVLNSGFETWNNDTIYFPGIQTVPKDTFVSLEPGQWTTSNYITGADSMGSLFFVTRSASNHSGSYSMRLHTDTVKLPFLPGVPSKLTIPGFALNGRFPISASSLTSSSVISPVSILGSGQPMNKRLAKIKGYYNYDPIFNDNATKNRYDSCVIWATLRKGQTIVAEAIFKSADSTGGFVAFEKSFTYVSCEMPDTLVFLVASSIPTLTDILSNTSGLKPGSVLWVDDLEYDTLAASQTFAPFVRNDVDTAQKDVAKTVLIKANDEDCDNPLAGLTINVTAQPVHGTTAVNGTTSITYTPTTGYTGVDSFFYTLNDGTNTSTPGRVKMLVLAPSGIDDVSVTHFAVFPVPANDALNVQCDYKGKVTVQVYDLLGSLISSTTLTTEPINTSKLITGVYGLVLTNENGQVLARTKFTVAK